MFMYKEFITDKIPEEVRQFYSKKKLFPAFGDNSFVEWVKETFLKNKVQNYEIDCDGIYFFANPVPFF